MSADREPKCALALTREAHPLFSSPFARHLSERERSPVPPERSLSRCNRCDFKYSEAGYPLSARGEYASASGMALKRAFYVFRFKSVDGRRDDCALQETHLFGAGCKVARRLVQFVGRGQNWALMGRVGTSRLPQVRTQRIYPNQRDSPDFVPLTTIRRHHGGRLQFEFSFGRSRCGPVANRLSPSVVLPLKPGKSPSVAFRRCGGMERYACLQSSYDLDPGTQHPGPGVCGRTHRPDLCHAPISCRAKGDPWISRFRRTPRMADGERSQVGLHGFIFIIKIENRNRSERTKEE
jgi:hypothetical protein